MANNPMIVTEALFKQYGDVRAVDGVDLAVEKGSIVGVLGPNGAGKTTVVRILTTLARADGGRAWVAGHDVATEAAAVRRTIGVTGQSATLDDALTARQNLLMVGQLSRLARSNAAKRADELLDLFELTDAANRVVRGYSGGMRRRLDLAASLVMNPPLLFLDEPTTGLDPTSRQRMWTIIRRLVENGATVLLTTQYLDEADSLADRIVVMNHGRVIAEGTPADLKASTGSQLLDVTLSLPHPLAQQALASLAAGPISVGRQGRQLRVPARNQPGLALAALRALDQVGADVEDIKVHTPSLDDVFALLTGAAPGQETEVAA